MAGAVATVLAGLLFSGMFADGEPSSALPLPSPTAAVAAEATPKPEPEDELFLQHVVPYLKKYCVDCHGNDFAEAELNVEPMLDRKVAMTERKKWDKIVGMLDIGAMPPDGAAMPTMDESRKVLDWVDQTLYFVDCSLPPDPGRVTIRRLNRAEYNNTIRDLVGVKFQPAADFPTDDVGYGFDNIGDVLSLSPLLVEKYLDAAEKITAAAIVPDDPTRGKTIRRDGDRLTAQNAHRDGDGFWAMPSSGNVSTKFDFPRTGEYVLRVEAKAQQAGPDKAKIEFRIDGKAVQVAEIKAHQTPEVLEFKLKIEKGQRAFAAAFINDYYKPEAPDPKDRDRNAYVGWLEVQGPLGLDLNSLPETHRRIVFTRPNEGEPVRRAATEVLAKFVKRAYRRPVTDEDIDPLVKLVEYAVEQGDTFEGGIQVAVQAVLVSPHFLFRVERDRDPNDPKDTHKLAGHELASRLSYFLWASLPDDQLFTLAELGQLHRPEILEQQVRRMLADPKAGALVTQFGGQWLNLRLLDESFPNQRAFPGFDNRLKTDFRRETEMFFEYVMREDRSILDFLDADYTFVNERLAKHYGIGGVNGDKFEKVSLAGTQRGGVLTHASILTLTSDPTRTSPVKRGKWIMENILGTPPPPPPPNVPLLETTTKANPNADLRARMAQHMADPVCASCHKLMDPLGFTFENFDGVGKWRDKDGKHEIDASGTLPGGDEFAGPRELMDVLKGRKDQFARHLTRQMLTYALGRGIEHYDRCALDEITAVLAANDYTFSTLVLQIVKSEPFLMRRGEGTSP